MKLIIMKVKLAITLLQCPLSGYWFSKVCDFEYMYMYVYARRVHVHVRICTSSTCTCKSFEPWMIRLDSPWIRRRNAQMINQSKVFTWVDRIQYQIRSVGLFLSWLNIQKFKKGAMKKFLNRLQKREEKILIVPNVITRNQCCLNAVGYIL